jgi:hypothetical protein
MYTNVPPALVRAFAYPPDTAKAWPEPDRRPSHSISPAEVANNHRGARRQSEARAEAILLALGREAATTRIHPLACSVMT